MKGMHHFQSIYERAESLRKGIYYRGAALGTAGTAVAVPEFHIISSVFREIFHFVGKPTNLVGF